MAITTADQLTAAIAGGQQVNIQKASITSVSGFWYSQFTAAGQPGAGSHNPNNITSGVLMTDATAGSVTIAPFGVGNTGYIANLRAHGSAAGVRRLVDLIYAVGRISLNSAATTTFTGQPSIAGRVPNGDYTGVELWLVMETANSAVNTTVTVSYTNADGVSGRTATLDTSLNATPALRLLPFRLQAGDNGVQRIDSVTVATPGTGFITLYLVRTLGEACITGTSISEPMQDFFKLGAPQVFEDSCLALWMLATGTSTGFHGMMFEIING